MILINYLIKTTIFSYQTTIFVAVLCIKSCERDKKMGSPGSSCTISKIWTMSTSSSPISCPFSPSFLFTKGSASAICSSAQNSVALRILAPRILVLKFLVLQFWHLEFWHPFLKNHSIYREFPLPWEQQENCKAFFL